MKGGLVFIGLLAPLVAADTPVGYGIADAATTLLAKGVYGSSLYSLDVEELGDGTAFVLDSYGGTRYELGYDMGLLIGDKMRGSVNALLGWMTQGHLSLQYVLEKLCVWQWEIALSLQTPQDYLEEMRGMTDGAAAAAAAQQQQAGAEKIAYPYTVGEIAAMAAVLANLPGDGDDVVKLLLNELPAATRREIEAGYRARGGEAATLEAALRDSKKAIRWLNAACSNFGAFGNRTVGGGLFTGRNLDWSVDTGLNQYKLVTVYHPPGGAHAHATIGFAGVTGALTGISSQGVTVHEANLESDRDSFYGFPWTLRLRAVMERTATLADATALWDATNNTCGFNHAVGSAADAAFVAIETDAGHSAYFAPMDPREVSGEGGDPRPDAVFRTNHGFDPQSVAHYQWNGTGADADSRYRYALFPQLFDAVAPGQYDALQAVHTAAVLGQKGEDYWHCGGAGTYGDASNVISAAFAPVVGKGTLYAAWEVGTGETWTPSCCSTYVKMDLEGWW